MPECIVCKENYEVGQPCKRCGSDNNGWEEWKREEKALGPKRALLRFLEPYFGLPLMIAGWALAFGLMGIIWPWGGVKIYVCILAVALTFVGCVLTVPAVYEKRFSLREQELLRRVKRGRAKGLGVGTRVLIVSVVTLGLIILLMLLLVQSEAVWKLMEWLMLEDTTTVEGSSPPQEELGFKDKIRRAFPLACLGGYITLVAFAYSSSLMLGQAYAKRLSEEVPPPIFLQERLLVKIVRREAERVVCRPITQKVTGDEKAPNGDEKAPDETEQEPRSWTWDEMERTDDGGIRLKAIVKAPSEAGKSSIEWAEDIIYVVEADPWSRITKVGRVKGT